MKLSLKNAYRNGNEENFHVIVEDDQFTGPIELIYHCNQSGFYNYYQLDSQFGIISDEIFKLVLDKLVAAKESMRKEEENEQK